MMDASKSSVGWPGLRSGFKRFRPTGRPALRLLLKRSRQARLAGDHDTAVSAGRLAVRMYPNELPARLHLSRVIRDVPTDGAEADELIELITVAFEQSPGNVRFVEVATELLFRLTAFGDHRRLDIVIDLLADCPATTVARTIGTEAGKRISLGNTDDAVAVARRYFETVPTGQSAATLHRILIRIGDLEASAKLSDHSLDEGLITLEQWTFQRNDGDFMLNSHRDVVDRLEALRPQRSSRYSSQLIQALSSMRRWQEILDYLDGTAHGLAPVTESVHRIDALLGVGRRAEAAELTMELAEDHLTDLRVFRRLLPVLHDKLGAEAAGVSLGQRMSDLEARLRQRPEGMGIHGVAALSTLYFELDDFDGLDRIVRQSSPEDIGPTTGRLIARAAYLRRDFDGTYAALDALDPSARTWDMEKLHGRTLLEEGRFTDAISVRRRLPQIDGGLDEVLYHALLCNGEIDEAFAMYSPPTDHRSFRAAFGDHAESEISTDPVHRRMIIAQAGPGDEVSLASVYELIAQRSNELVVTCDPRLRSLLSRSLPTIDFLAVDRGGQGNIEPLYPTVGALLDESAARVAATCDRIIPLRAVAGLKHELLGASPAKPYLTPQPALRAQWSDRFGCTQHVGLVWRSEVGGSQRNIHYLKVVDFEPLLQQGHQFVCLQYDATKAEREYLVAQCGNRITFPDEIDLRNDFEQAAALLSALSATVGIGTTTIELSGAVGTPTIMMQPTHFGTWRAQSPKGSDYWHQTVQVTNLDRPWILVDLVEQAMNRLANVLTDAQ